MKSKIHKMFLWAAVLLCLTALAIGQSERLVQRQDPEVSEEVMATLERLEELTRQLQEMEQRKLEQWRQLDELKGQIGTGGLLRDSFRKRRLEKMVGTLNKLIWQSEELRKERRELLLSLKGKRSELKEIVHHRVESLDERLKEPGMSPQERARLRAERRRGEVWISLLDGKGDRLRGDVPPPAMGVYRRLRQLEEELKYLRARIDQLDRLLVEIKELLPPPPPPKALEQEFEEQAAPPLP